MRRPYEVQLDYAHVRSRDVRRFPVIVNGWSVPHLDAYTYDDRPGIVTIVCDERMATDVPEAVARNLLPFLAQVVAVAKGWTCHPDSPDWEPPEFLGRGPSRQLPWYRVAPLAPEEIGGNQTEGDN